ncbi:hypothetical protein [Actinomadura sp. WAC 06369]|uniref:hypothetical protein n=1 Tax=Actinomadura sp. WAC 06369 TaxID=2203193 RepID=UPI000F78587A|nr:hypothetical protein [Actinomadura sp. WAC 06369]
MGVRAAGTIVGSLMAGAAVFVTGAGCGSETFCTMEMVPQGIRVEVRPADAARIESASLEVCWDGVCRTPRIVFGPSTTSVPQGCDGDGPDAACGASASPDGGKTGFAKVEGLPDEPVEVRIALRDGGGAAVLEKRLRVTPDGGDADCPKGPQARLVVAGGDVTAG